MEKIAMMEQLARSILEPHEASLQKCRYAIGIDVLASVFHAFVKPNAAVPSICSPEKKVF